MRRFGKKLIVFGGSGKYEPSIKRRISHNDVKVFDTVSKDWNKEVIGLRGQVFV